MTTHIAMVSPELLGQRELTCDMMFAINALWCVLEGQNTKIYALEWHERTLTDELLEFQQWFHERLPFLSFPSKQAIGPSDHGPVPISNLSPHSELADFPAYIEFVEGTEEFCRHKVGAGHHFKRTLFEVCLYFHIREIPCPDFLEVCLEEPEFLGQGLQNLLVTRLWPIFVDSFAYVSERMRWFAYGVRDHIFRGAFHKELLEMLFTQLVDRRIDELVACQSRLFESWMYALRPPQPEEGPETPKPVTPQTPPAPPTIPTKAAPKVAAKTAHKATKKRTAEEQEAPTKKKGSKAMFSSILDEFDSQEMEDIFTGFTKKIGDSTKKRKVTPEGSTGERTPVSTALAPIPEEESSDGEDPEEYWNWIVDACWDRVSQNLESELRTLLDWQSLADEMYDAVALYCEGEGQTWAREIGKPQNLQKHQSGDLKLKVPE